jgi:hypothetical protein
MTALPPIEFTDREIDLIIRALPDNCDLRRLELLRHILRCWGRDFLPMHLAPSAAGDRLQHIAKVGKTAGDLIQAIDALDKSAQFELALLQIGIVEGSTLAAAVGRESQNRDRLAEFQEFAAALAAAAQNPLSKRRRGRPRNIRSILIMRDLAAMFEYVTRLSPTRRVSLTWMTIEPIATADLPRAPSSRVRGGTAKAGIAGNTLRVAAVTGAFCRNERLVGFATVAPRRKGAAAPTGWPRNAAALVPRRDGGSFGCSSSKIFCGHGRRISGPMRGPCLDTEPDQSVIRSPSRPAVRG